jgi:hypothetical protein
MSNLSVLEAATGGPFWFRYEGQNHLLPDPADLPFQTVLAILDAERIPDALAMPEWKRARLFAAWAAHYDLPDFQSAQRLSYLVDHYRSALVYDLQSFLNVDLGDLWRSRRWRTLLDHIDHLPGHSWYSAAVSTDEDHAAMIAESLASREQEGEVQPKGPSLQSWTPEVAAITRLTDAVKEVSYVVAAVNYSGKGARPQPPKPEPRPRTPLEAAIQRADFNRRKASHDKLVKRLLPHKR